MTAPRSTEQLLHAFLAEGLTELPDRTYDAVRRDIHGARQRGLIVPRRVGGLSMGRWLGVAVAVAVVVVLAALDLRPIGGPGGVSTPAPTASTTPSIAASNVGSPAPATSFTSPLYGYTLTVPAGWIAAPAVLPWDGDRQSGPDAESDKLAGPDGVLSWVFAGPYAGKLDTFVQERIAANHRDHADTCPEVEPAVNEPVAIGAKSGVFVAWNCGAVINLAMTVRAGVAYVFVFRDLSIKASTDPADRALFQSILDSVVFPS
jgi:hypothetical protein